MKWPLSKTVWGAIIVGVSGVWKAVDPDSPIPDILLGIGGALGLIGVRHAISKMNGQ